MMAKASTKDRLNFRRTLASYLYTEIRADELTAKAVLNHYDGRPVAVYTRLNYDRLAEIIQAYADWVCKLAPHESVKAQAQLDFSAPAINDREVSEARAPS